MCVLQKIVSETVVLVCRFTDFIYIYIYIVSLLNGDSVEICHFAQYYALTFDVFRTWFAPRFVIILRCRYENESE